MPQFPCFFLKSSLKFHVDFIFFIVKARQMKSKGRTAHTTASRTVCMNMGRLVGDSRPIKNKKESHFKVENMCALIIIVVK